MEKISFDLIINFIKEAISRKYYVDAMEWNDEERTTQFSIFNGNGKEIQFTFRLEKNLIIIENCRSSNEYIRINHNFTEKQKLQVEELKLDVKEMNENKIIDHFNNFYSDLNNSIKDINELDEDD